MIYEIVCNITGERYIGSTFEPTVARRVAYHRSKSNTCSSKQIIEREDYCYGLLEKIQVKCTRDELRMCERKSYDELECINKNKPFSTKEEYNKAYRKANHVHILEQQKAYRETNRDKQKEYQKANREKQKEYQKEYREANREKQNAYNKANREHKKSYNKAYREKARAQRLKKTEDNI